MNVGFLVGAVLVLSPDRLPMVKISVNNQRGNSGKRQAVRQGEGGTTLVLEDSLYKGNSGGL